MSSVLNKGPLKINNKVLESDCSLLAFKYPNKNDNNDTCLSDNALNKIGGDIKTVKQNTGCDTDICILTKYSSKISDDEILRIKPEGPKNTNEWYSNFNIDDYFTTIEKTYPHYKHIKFTTIDFEKINHELSNVSVLDLIKENKACFGCVINTDVSTGRGKHWLSVFFNMDLNNKKCTAEFFNSSGNKPGMEIHAWLLKQKNICEKNNFECEIVIASTMRHQFSDTECGPYSCYYITSRLTGVPYSYFKSNRIDDKIVEEFRKYMFRN
jgi:hypothetical protein